MCSNTTTNKTELPEPTDEELKMLAFQEALIEANLREQGFDMETVETQVFENPARVSSLENSVESLISERERVQAELTRAQGEVNKNVLQERLAGVDSQLRKAREDLENEQAKVTTSYDIDISKAEDPRVQALLDKGKRSEANALREELSSQELSFLDQKDAITAGFLDAAEKVLTGDLSITSQQEAQIKAIQEKYRDPIMNMIGDIKEQIGITRDTTLESLGDELDVINTTFSKVSDALDAVGQQIDQTGFEVEEALIQAEATAQKNGVNMTEALQQTIAASRALAEQNLFETTRDLRIANAELAVGLGRESTDEAFVRDLNENLLSAVKSTELNLAVQEATGVLGIQQNLANVLQDIANFRTDFASEQGKKREGLAGARASLEEETGLRREGVAGRVTDTKQSAGLRLEDVAKLRVGAEEQTQKIGLGLREQVAMPFQALASGGQFQTQTANIGQLPIQNLFQSGSAATQALEGQRNLRKAQPTQTQTQTQSPLATIFDVAGVGVDVGKLFV